MEIYKPKVCRNAASTGSIDSFPMTRSISLAAIVAILSVITTESVSKPERLPLDEDINTVTRLGWLARNNLLVIIATMTWGKPVSSLSA